MPRQSDFTGLEALGLDADEAMDELVELAELTDLPETAEVAEYAEFAEDSPSWPRPVAATPRTRTSSPCRHRS